VTEEFEFEKTICSWIEGDRCNPNLKEIHVRSPDSLPVSYHPCLTVLE
jgi:hypothetical protein